MGKRLRELLLPDPPRAVPHARAFSVALRTVHIAVVGILVGGHVYGVAHERLVVPLYLGIASGVGLMALGFYPSCRWFVEGRGLTVLLKLAILLTIPFFWDYRVPLLLLVVVIASIGSHMPSRFRHAVPFRRRGTLSATHSEPAPRKKPSPALIGGGSDLAYCKCDHVDERRQFPLTAPGAMK